MIIKKGEPRSEDLGILQLVILQPVSEVRSVQALLHRDADDDLFLPDFLLDWQSHGA